MLHRIAELAASGDCEAAHALEDTLHLETLVAIANNETISGTLLRHFAWLASTSNDIPFDRHAA